MIKQSFLNYKQYTFEGEQNLLKHLKSKTHKQMVHVLWFTVLSLQTSVPTVRIAVALSNVCFITVADKEQHNRGHFYVFH